MDLRFKRLKLKDFKGVKDFQITFDDKITNLYGENATGKTTLVDALFWVFFGKDSRGRTTFELFPLDENNVLIPNTLPYVELECLISGVKNVFTRSKNGSTTEFTINGASVKAKEYERHIGAVVSEEIFATLISPVYFGDNYTWQKQRTTIVDNLNIKDTVVELDKYSDITADILQHGADKAQKKWEDERKAFENSKLSITGERDYLMKKLEGVEISEDQEVLVKQKEEKDAKIKEMLTSLDLIHPIKDSLNATVSNIQKLESEHSLKIRQKELEIANMKQQKAKLGEDYKAKMSELTLIKDKCSLCGHDLDELSVATQKQTIKDAVEVIKAKGLAKGEEITKAEAELLNLKSMEIAKDDKAMKKVLEDRIKEIESKVDYEKIEAERTLLNQLETQIKSFEVLAKDKADLQSSITRLRKVMVDFDDADEKVILIKEYKTEYAQLVADTINAKLTNVQIKTFVEQKNGELKDTFEITMNGVPYSALNSAGKIIAGVELIQLLSEALHVNFPIVIDNKESITKEFDVPNQIITLSVLKGASLGV